MSEAPVSSSRPITIIPYQANVATSVGGTSPQLATSQQLTTCVGGNSQQLATSPLLLRGLRLFRIADPSSQSKAVTCVPVSNVSPEGSGGSAVDPDVSRPPAGGSLLQPPATPPRAASVPPNKTALVTVSPRPSSVGPSPIMLAQDGSSPALHLLAPPNAMLSPTTHNAVHHSSHAVPQTLYLSSRSQCGAGPSYVTIANPVQASVNSSMEVGSTRLINASVTGRHFLSRASSNLGINESDQLSDTESAQVTIADQSSSNIIMQDCSAEDESSATACSIPPHNENLSPFPHDVNASFGISGEGGEECNTLEEIERSAEPRCDGTMEAMPRVQLQLRFSKRQLERFREESSACSVASDDMSEYTDKNTDILDEEEELDDDVDEDEEVEDEEDEDEVEDVDFTGLTSADFVAEQLQHLTEQEQLQLKQLQEQQIQLERQIEHQQQLLQLQQQHQEQLKYLGDPDEDQHDIEAFDDSEDRNSSHYLMKRNTQAPKEHEVFDVEDDEDHIVDDQHLEHEHEVVELNDEDEEEEEQDTQLDDADPDQIEHDEDMLVDQHEGLEMLENMTEPTVVDLESGDTLDSEAALPVESVDELPLENVAEDTTEGEVMEVAHDSSAVPTSEPLSHEPPSSSHPPSSMSLRSSRRCYSSAHRSHNLRSSADYKLQSSVASEEVAQTSDDQELSELQSKNDVCSDDQQVEEDLVSDTRDASKDVDENPSSEPLAGDVPRDLDENPELKEDAEKLLPDLDNCSQDIGELGSIHNIDDCLSNIESLDNIEDCPSNLNSLGQIDDYPSNIDSFDNIDECPSSLEQIDDLPSTIDSPSNVENLMDHNHITPEKLESHKAESDAEPLPDSLMEETMVHNQESADQPAGEVVTEQPSSDAEAPQEMQHQQFQVDETANSQPCVQEGECLIAVKPEMAAEGIEAKVEPGDATLPTESNVVENCQEAAVSQVNMASFVQQNQSMQANVVVKQEVSEMPQQVI